MKLGKNRLEKIFVSSWTLHLYNISNMFYYFLSIIFSYILVKENYTQKYNGKIPHQYLSLKIK